MTDQPTIGVQITRITESGADRLVLRVMKRYDGDHYPQNIGSFDGDKLHLCELAMNWYIDEGDKHIFGGEPEYRAFMILRHHEIEQMAHTLKRVNAKLRACNSYDVGDKYMAFCAAVGAKFCVVETERSRSSWLRDSTWRFMSVTEGRNHLRDLVKQIATEAMPATYAA